MTIFNQAKNYKDQSETLLFRLCICLIYFVGKEYLKQKNLERTTAQYLPRPKTHKSNVLSRVIGPRLLWSGIAVHLYFLVCFFKQTSQLLTFKHMFAKIVQAC